MPKPSMRARVDAAVRAADHLGPKDAGAVQLARTLAAAIDQAYAEDPDGPAYRKYIGWASPNLLNALRALGLTPDGADKAGARKGPKPVNRLQEMRRARDTALRVVPGDDLKPTS